MKCVCVCVCSGSTLCYVSVYQCGLWRSVCVGTEGLCSPGFGRGVCSGGSWWRFRVWGLCVFVVESLLRFWLFSVVVG